MPLDPYLNSYSYDLRSGASLTAAAMTPLCAAAVGGCQGHWCYSPHGIVGFQPRRPVCLDREVPDCRLYPEAVVGVRSWQLRRLTFSTLFPDSQSCNTLFSLRFFLPYPKQALIVGGSSTHPHVLSTIPHPHRRTSNPKDDSAHRWSVTGNNLSDMAPAQLGADLESMVSPNQHQTMYWTTRRNK